jgi:3-hydroxybutyrate dehydrogenase
LRRSNAAAISDIRASAPPERSRHAQRKIRRRHRFHLRHRARHRARLRQGGRNLTINGFGDKTAIEKERAGIETEFGVKAIYSGADMTKPAEIAEMISATEKAFGAVDVLVNNAGIQFVAKVEDFPIEKWDAVIATNLSAAFHTARVALPGMKARKWGRIINIASAHGLVASGEKAAYVAAKHGIVGLTKVIAVEARMTASPAMRSAPAGC